MLPLSGCKAGRLPSLSAFSLLATSQSFKSPPCTVLLNLELLLFLPPRPTPCFWIWSPANIKLSAWFKPLWEERQNQIPALLLIPYLSIVKVSAFETYPVMSEIMQWISIEKPSCKNQNFCKPIPLRQPSAPCNFRAHFNVPPHRRCRVIIVSRWIYLCIEIHLTPPWDI